MKLRKHFKIRFIKKVSLSLLLISTSFLLAAQSPKYEFRAAWVATVSNIDWPSKPGLSTKEQQKEAIDILEMNKELGMNAIILQVRPCSDALYNSTLEPWSRYLSGTPGEAPAPYYDPLAFWIDEAHKRGMELHAWLNPFRVAQNKKEALAGNHIAFKHPDWILTYGNRLYFDPGLPETGEFVGQVVQDIVSRYDIDAIHFDDYFYPYPLKEEFPDTSSFMKYGAEYSPDQKSSWRRENVDRIIQNLSAIIKKTKPWVKFGISPFGVWRNADTDPTGSQTNAGITNYDHLYADVIKWQRLGWIDYLAPQIYWYKGHPAADYETLVKWWSEHSYDRALYIGHALYKVDQNSNNSAWTNPGELPRQIKQTRTNAQVQGSAFYSSKHFKRNLLGFQDSLVHQMYHHPAIVPPMPWIDKQPPLPVVRLKKSGRKISWKTKSVENIMDSPDRYVIYINESSQEFDNESNRHMLSITPESQIKLPRLNKKKKDYEIRISVLDRLNNESLISAPVRVKL